MIADVKDGRFGYETIKLIELWAEDNKSIFTFIESKCAFLNTIYQHAPCAFQPLQFSLDGNSENT